MKYKFDKEDMCFISALAIIIVGAIIFIATVHYRNNNRSIFNHEFDIVSIKNDKYLEGDFFIGIGYIGENEYYVGYFKIKNGYKRFKIRSSEVTVFENDTVIPKIIIKENSYKTSGIHEVMRYISFGYRWGGWSIEIIVPKNTIIKRFTLE